MNGATLQNGRGGLTRKLLPLVGLLLLLALVGLVAYPGPHPAREWLTLLLCLGGGIGAFEVRRRTSALLRAYARAHGALLSTTNPRGGSPA